MFQEGIVQQFLLSPGTPVKRLELETVCLRQHGRGSRLRNDAGDRGQQPAIALCRNVMLKCITMKKASIRELRYSFKRIERLLQQGDEIQITKRRQVIARLVPEPSSRPTMPDFVGRLRAIYGNETLKISGAELIEQDRSRY